MSDAIGSVTKGDGAESGHRVSASRSVATSSFLLPAWSLLLREVVRFLRDRSRVVGALGTPAVFWLVIGGGVGRSFQAPGFDVEVSYLEYTYPGMMVLMVLFTAIFSTITVIDDRREGFMQSVLAAPVRRSAIAAGKIGGSAVLAVLQALLFLALAPLAGISLSIGVFVAAVFVLAVMSLGLSGLGFLMAWRMQSTQGFHAIMNLFLMPMWLLSGAFFPAEGAALPLKWLIVLNPLTYAVASLRHALYLNSPGVPGPLPGVAVSAVVMVIATAAVLVLAARAVARPIE